MTSPFAGWEHHLNASCPEPEHKKGRVATHTVEYIARREMENGCENKNRERVEDNQEKQRTGVKTRTEKRMITRDRLSQKWKTDFRNYVTVCKLNYPLLKYSFKLAFCFVSFLLPLKWSYYTVVRVMGSHTNSVLILGGVVVLQNPAFQYYYFCIINCFYLVKTCVLITDLP